MAYRDLDVRRARDRERFHRRTAERIARGLCPKCGARPPEPDRGLCAPCSIPISTSTSRPAPTCWPSLGSTPRP